MIFSLKGKLIHLTGSIPSFSTSLFFKCRLKIKQKKHNFPKDSPLQSLLAFVQDDVSQPHLLQMTPSNSSKCHSGVPAASSSSCGCRHSGLLPPGEQEEEDVCEQSKVLFIVCSSKMNFRAYLSCGDADIHNQTALENIETAARGGQTADVIWNLEFEGV